MNEIKGYFTAIFIIVFWSAMCGFGGYILSNSRAIGQLEQANQQLKELGWIVLRFWDVDINKHLNECVQTVKDTVFTAKSSDKDY